LWIIKIQLLNIRMGRITEFFDYIKTKTKPEEREELYTHMSVNDKIKKARKEYLKRKKGDTK